MSHHDLMICRTVLTEKNVEIEKLKAKLSKLEPVECDHCGDGMYDYSKYGLPGNCPKCNGTCKLPSEYVMVKREVLNTVNEQAEDEGLWFIAQTAPEGYLQQELRKLHAVIEAYEPDCALHIDT